MLKRCGILLLVIVCLLGSLTSCNCEDTVGTILSILFAPVGGYKEINRRGLDKYHVGDLDYNLCCMPLDMLDFPYTDGDYYGYLEAGPEKYSPWPFGKTFVYLVYDAEIYPQAKTYMLQTMSACRDEGNPAEQIGEYVFYRHKFDSENRDSTLVHWCGYSDTRQALYFFSLYCKPISIDSTEIGETYAARYDAIYEEEGVSGILKEYYSEYYDFGI